MGYEVKGISEAIIGAAGFKPSEFPASGFAALSSTGSLAELAFEALAPYFAGDRLFGALPEICCEAFDFPLALVPALPGCNVLELFGGPGETALDFGVRFLAAIMKRLRPDRELWAEARTENELRCFIKAYSGSGLRLHLFFGGKAGELPDLDGVILEGPSPDGEGNAMAQEGGWIAVDLRNTACVLGQSVPFIYSSLHEAIAASKKHNSKEIMLSNFIVPQPSSDLLPAIFHARAIGAPVGKVVVAEIDNHEISGYLKAGVGEPPRSLTGLLGCFSEKEIARSLSAFSASENEMMQAKERAKEKTGYELSFWSSACEAVRFSRFPIQASTIVMPEPPER